MHPNPAFRQITLEENFAFAAERGFGTVSVNGESGPLVSHVPFVIEEGSAYADLHLVRSNPMAKAVKTAVPAVLAVSGPDAYVSPDWYQEPGLVPTWNYVAVHLRGELAPLGDGELASLLDRLSAQFEKRLLPKPMWTTEKVDNEALARMMRMIQPFRLTISDVQGTWKLGQNKPDQARMSAARHMDAFGFGLEPRLLAGLMKSAAEKDDTQ